MKKKDAKQDELSGPEGIRKAPKKLPAGAAQDCQVISGSGARCTGYTYHGRNWCNVHDPDRTLKKDKFQIGDYSPGPITTPEQIAKVIEFVVQALFADKIRIDKSRAIMEALKQQLVVLNEIYKRSPEGREKSFDEVSRMMVIVQGLSHEKAAELLNSKDFVRGVEIEAEVRELQEKKTQEESDIEDALQTLHAGDILQLPDRAGNTGDDLQT